MYNEDIKLSYLSTIENKSSRNTARNLLISVGDTIESQAEKDIAEMSYSELKRAIESMGIVSVSTISTTITRLRRYFRWYNDNIKKVSVFVDQEFTVRDIDLSYPIKEKLFKDEDELIESCSYLDAEDGYFEVIIPYLIWYGLTIKEILLIKNEDISELGDGTLLVNTNNKSIHIKSKEFSNALRVYSRVDSAVRQHRTEWIVTADDIGFFIKNMYPKNYKLTGRPIPIESIRRRISRYNLILPDGVKQISEQSVLLSGRLWRVREDERAFKKVRTSTIISEFGSKSRQDISNNLWIYEYYKKAFGE